MGCEGDTNMSRGYKLITGYREICYFCKLPWGRCSCPTCTPFVYGELSITEPMISTCLSFFVNPVTYYGESYTAWVGRTAYEDANLIETNP